MYRSAFFLQLCSHFKRDQSPHAKRGYENWPRFIVLLKLRDIDRRDILDAVVAMSVSSDTRKFKHVERLAVSQRSTKFCARESQAITTVYHKGRRTAGCTTK